MLNTVLRKSAAAVMSNTSPAQFTITAHFISAKEGSKFSFYPLRVDELTIERDYIENFADVIDMSMIISPKDYALMQDQGQDLLCILTITYYDKNGHMVFKPTPIRRQYNVIINNPRDIRKAMPDAQKYTEPQAQLSVQLVEPTIYKLRHTKLNTVFQNATPTVAIHSLTQMFGIERLQMVPLDNTHQYDHIDFASFQGIDSIFLYMQSRFGLYQKGATNYITNDVLYIYPPFETNPTYDKTAIFYQVTTGDYSGSHIFHKVEDKSVSVVVNSQPESYDLSIAGSENEGTGFIFTRATRMVDGFTTVDSKDGASFTDTPALSVTLNNSRTAEKGLNNLVHIPATDNPFPKMSSIIMHQASLMQMTWMNCDPFQIDPGHAVKYYYDEDEVMKMKTGVVESAKYRLSPIAKMDAKDLFGAVGELVLRLSPNESKTL